MFGPFKKEDLKQTAANALLTQMTTYGPNATEYERNLTYLERIEALQTKNRRPKLTPDQIVQGVSSLAGILIIVAYEQKHVFGSKAQNFIPKVK